MLWVCKQDASQALENKTTEMAANSLQYLGGCCWKAEQKGKSRISNLRDAKCPRNSTFETPSGEPPLNKGQKVHLDSTPFVWTRRLGRPFPMPGSDDEASQDASHSELQKMERKCENGLLQDAQKQTLVTQSKEQSPVGETEAAIVNSGT
jgi:hypothetical protein